MTNLTSLSIAAAIEMLKSREISAVELVQAHLKAIEEKKDLNAFIEVTQDKALQQANEADERIKRNQSLPLDGIPIGIKDIFCTKGIKTTCSSKMLYNFVPPYESTVTQKLFDNGAICIGKTNMDEFAMGSASITGFHGNVINPWKRKNDVDAKLVAGGSSGGSAAAVAAGLSMAALGSDTGGSIRQPASFTGIVGVKPSYGRCSRWGMIAFSSSLDQAGVFARSVRDSAIVLQTICGYDDKESTSAKLAVPDFLAASKRSIKGMKIGIPQEYKVEGMNEELLSLWQEGEEWLRDCGAEIIPINLPNTSYALPVYYIIAPAEASSNLARYDGVRYGLRISREGQKLQDMISETRANGFGSEVKRRIMIGTYVLSASAHGDYYTKAQKVRRMIANDFSLAYNKVDAILTPTAPTTAFAVDEKNDDPVIMYLNDMFTVPASLAGLPAMSVPVRISTNDGLPWGLQIIGNRYDEESIFAVGAALERASSFQVKIK